MLNFDKKFLLSLLVSVFWCTMALLLLPNKIFPPGTITAIIMVFSPLMLIYTFAIAILKIDYKKIFFMVNLFSLIVTIFLKLQFLHFLIFILPLCFTSVVAVIFIKVICFIDSFVDFSKRFN